MHTPNTSLNIAAFSNLQEQAESIQSTGTDLPAVAPQNKAWADFQKTSELHAPYIAQLNHSIKDIQQFIGKHAVPGAQRKTALSNLQHLLNTKVNCEAKHLSPLTVNENRRNLNLFSQQLKNPEIPLEKKLSAALNLAQGLGVCTEGETLNILESTQQLCQQQGGLAGLLVQTKNTLVEQHLQQLVKHEDSLYLRDNVAKEVEIHHVQALKNHVAEDWGLSVVEDRYALRSYQTRTGNMAKALLKETITPVLLANTVAEKLGQALVNHTASSLTTGMPSDQLKTEPLLRAIQAEFGSSIKLEECLEFNEDYSEVRLKPQADLALHVMKAFKDIGLIDQQANPNQLLAHTTPSIQQAIDVVNDLRVLPDRRLKISISSSFWLGAVNNNDEREKKKHEAGPSPSSLRHNIKRF